MCTRKGYAASVSQLTLATATLYFKLFKLHSRGERSVENRRRFHQRLLKLICQSFSQTRSFALLALGLAASSASVEVMGLRVMIFT